MAWDTEIDFKTGPSQLVKVESSSMKQRQVFKSDFNFEDFGIGGLKSEFATIFRRAFASRCFPT